MLNQSAKLPFVSRNQTLKCKISSFFGSFRHWEVAVGTNTTRETPKTVSSETPTARTLFSGTDRVSNNNTSRSPTVSFRTSMAKTHGQQLDTLRDIRRFST